MEGGYAAWKAAQAASSSSSAAPNAMPAVPQKSKKESTGGSSSSSGKKRAHESGSESDADALFGLASLADASSSGRQAAAHGRVLGTALSMVYDLGYQ